MWPHHKLLWTSDLLRIARMGTLTMRLMIARPTDTMGQTGLSVASLLGLGRGFMGLMGFMATLITGTIRGMDITGRCRNVERSRSIISREMRRGMGTETLGRLAMGLRASMRCRDSMVVAAEGGRTGNG